MKISCWEAAVHEVGVLAYSSFTVRLSEVEALILSLKYLMSDQKSPLTYSHLQDFWTSAMVS